MVTGVVLAAFLVGGSAMPFEEKSIDRTRDIGSLTGELREGQWIDQVVEIEAASLVEVAVDQLDGDIAIAIIAPGGSELARSDLPVGGWVQERLMVVAPVAGVYSLRIWADEAGRASLARFETRPTGPHDTSLIAAFGLWTQSAELRRLQTAESLESRIELLERANSVAGDRHQGFQGLVLHELAGCYSMRGSTQEAEDRLIRSIPLLELVDDQVTLARALNDYADVLTNRGEGDAAEPLYRRALGIAQTGGGARIEALTWNNLGVLAYRRGNLELTVEMFEKALGLQVKIGDSSERSNTLANLGAVYRALGRYADALEASDSALELVRRVGDASSEIDVLNNRGVLFKAVGDLRSAADAYQAALVLVEATGARIVEATLAANLGSLYRLLGQPDRAEIHLERALAAAEAAGSPANEAWALQALGEMAREAGSPNAASYYQRARERSLAAGDRHAEAYSLTGLGRTRLEEGQPAEAMRSLEEARSIQEELTDRPGQMVTHRELGRVSAAMGDPTSARRHFLASLSLAELIGDPYQEAATRARYGRFLRDAGDLSAAVDQLTTSIETTEALRSTVVLPDQRAGLMSRSQGDYTVLVNVLSGLDAANPGQGFADRAFQVAERARARTLIELLVEGRENLEWEPPAGVLARQRDVRGRLAGTQKRLTRALREEEVDLPRVDELKAEILRLNHEREDLEREARRVDPRRQGLAFPQPIEAAAARRLLSQDQALVSFLVGDESSYVFLATRDGLSIEALPSEAVLKPLIEAMLNGLESPGRRGQGRLRDSAAKLFESLLGPIAGKLEGYRHLLIAADGPLHYLPFEALVVDSESPDIESLLISRWTVSYVPSATALQVLNARPVDTGERARPTLVAFADPALAGSETPRAGSRAVRGLQDKDSWRWPQLAGARREVQAIADLFDPSQVRLFVGDEASEAQFVSAEPVGSARYLHVAAHALVDNEEPALSALLLALDGNDSGDGLLQAHEVFDLSLSAELVVLSGCETALGRPVRGEGLVGLTRAFLYAGADAVSVSLWPIDDAATAELMTGFYRGLQAGEPAVEALRKAKLHLASQPASRHPYYWASFVLVGAPS